MRGTIRLLILWYADGLFMSSTAQPGVALSYKRFPSPIKTSLPSGIIVASSRRFKTCVGPQAAALNAQIEVSSRIYHMYLHRSQLDCEFHEEDRRLR